MVFSNEVRSTFTAMSSPTLLSDHVYVVEMRNSYKVVVGKTEGNRPCGRPGHRLEEDM